MTNNKNTLIIVLIVVIVLLLLGGFGSYNLMSGYNDGLMLLNWIFNIVILVLIIFGIYWLIKNINFNQKRR